MLFKAFLLRLIQVKYRPFTSHLDQFPLQANRLQQEAGSSAVSADHGSRVLGGILEMLRRSSVSAIQDLDCQWTPLLGQLVKSSRLILASPTLQSRRVLPPQSNACINACDTQIRMFSKTDNIRYVVPRLSCSSNLLATSFDLAASKIIQFFSSSTGQNASVGNSLMPLIHLHSLNVIDNGIDCCLIVCTNHTLYSRSLI